MTTLADRVRAHVHRTPPRPPKQLRLVSPSADCAVTIVSSPPVTYVAAQSRADEPRHRTPERDAAMRAVIAPPFTLCDRVLRAAVGLRVTEAGLRRVRLPTRS